MNPFEELLNLLMPNPCCGCKRLGAILCENCHDALVGAPRLVVRGNLAGWAFCDFGDQVSKILNAFKEDGQTRVAATLAAKMSPLLSHFSIPEFDGAAVVLVSVPSRSSSFVKRGFVPAQVLARQLAKQSGLRSVGALKLIRAVDDQAGLGVSERRTNMAQSMRAKFSLLGYRILIIDDIVTTGATILEARRALEIAGAQVIGFLTFAETMLKTPTRTRF
jgi:ComF family protein